MVLLALWHFFLLGQTQVFLAYPRSVPLLESASPAGTLAFISALNFLVPKCFVLFPCESLLLGLSGLAPFYFEHGTVSLLSSAFIHPSNICFLLAFLNFLSVTGIEGVGYFLAVLCWEGQISEMPEMARLTAQERAARNGVSIPQNEAVPVPLLAGKWGSGEPVHGLSTSPSHLPLHIVVFCGQSKKNGNVPYL